MRGAIFDMDGTLLDSMWMWRGLDEQILIDNGVPVPEDLGQKIVTMNSQQAAEYLSSNYLPHLEPEKIMENWEEMVWQAYRTVIAPKPLVPEYLRALKARGIKMCIATMTDRPQAETVLRRLGLWDLFEFIITVPEAGKSKHEPDIYFQCCKKLSLDPADCTVFEDAYYAVKTAKAAGFTVCGIYDDTSKLDWPAIERTADIAITDYRQLLEQL